LRYIYIYIFFDLRHYFQTGWSKLILFLIFPNFQCTFLVLSLTNIFFAIQLSLPFFLLDFQNKCFSLRNLYLLFLWFKTPRKNSEQLHLLPPKNAYCKFQGGVVVEAARVKLIFLHHLVGHCLGKLTATQLRRQGSANIWDKLEQRRIPEALRNQVQRGRGSGLGYANPVCTWPFVRPAYLLIWRWYDNARSQGTPTSSGSCCASGHRLQ